MERVKHQDVVFYQFTALRPVTGLVHGIFTRRGGASAPPFDSLNVGSTVGDDPDSVLANRRRVAEVMGFDERDTRTVWQVHGSDVFVARRGEPATDPPPQADGIITADPGLPLVMRFADCVPLVFYDPARRVIGLAHAGWRGTVAGVGPATVRAMVRHFGSRPGDIIAGIGPAIGPCCYEVGEEVIVQVRESFPGEDRLIIPPLNGHRGPHFDLWAANEIALRDAGVGYVETARLCTSCLSYEFFSHRAEAGRTGRFAALIALKDEGTA